MHVKQIVQLIRPEGKPFQPFDIKTSDARVYSVDHPEFISVSRDGRTVIYQTPEDDRTIWIDAGNIVALEVRNRPAAA